MQAIFGIFVFCFIAWAVSENRRRIDVRVLISGLLLQIVLAILLLKIKTLRDGLQSLNHIVTALDSATKAGTAMIFGYIGGGPAPFKVISSQHNFSLAFQSLPLVMVVGALTSLLFYWKILPRFVQGIAWVLKRTMGIGGAAGLGSAANIFVGMVEAPLFIKPYMARLTRSELFIIMASGMATIAGTMMVVYAIFLKNVSSIGDAALGHLLVASVLSAPASIVIARLMVPPGKDDQFTQGDISDPHPAQNSMDAITHGATEGLKLWLNIIALIIVLIAIVALVNIMLGGIQTYFYGPKIAVTWKLESFLGWLMQPFMWLMGIPWGECAKAGEFMGVKTVLNEFIAYENLATYLSQIETARESAEGITAGQVRLSDKTILILSYALCGFANFGSLGIMIGGLGTMAPERRAEIAGLGLKSILAGTLATMMTGAIVGLIY